MVCFNHEVLPCSLFPLWICKSAGMDSIVSTAEIHIASAGPKLIAGLAWEVSARWSARWNARSCLLPQLTFMEEVFHSPLHFMASEIDFLSPPEELGTCLEPMDTLNCRMVSDIPSGEQHLLTFKNIQTTVNASIWTTTRAIGLRHWQSPGSFGFTIAVLAFASRLQIGIELPGQHLVGGGMSSIGCTVGSVLKSQGSIFVRG